MFNNRYRPGATKEINYREEEKKILDSVMRPDNYDKRIRPSGINSTGEWWREVASQRPLNCPGCFWALNSNVDSGIKGEM